MESEQRVSRKGRKLGSSRRRQMRETADSLDAAAAPEPESWSSQAAAELQAFFQDCGAKERGFVTREDLAVAKFSFLSGEDELEMIFDWVDVEQKGRLSLEEFSSGLKNVFGSSTHGVRRKRPVPSERESAAVSLPVLEEADAEEKEAFFAFIQQLGAGHLLPEQAEIWQLWGKLRQEEPQLAGNLEGFLARMTSRLQEAQADKEALELTLRKRDSDHHREVQQLYEEMEQQILREKQQLQAESDSRGLAFSSQMQEVLEAKEREFQRLTEGQRELEAQVQFLSSTHQEANAENRQLREAERDLAGRLEEAQERLQVTRGHLNAARGHVSWQTEEEPSVPRAGEEKAPDTKAVSSEEAPLPGLFGDEDDWDQLLNSFNTSSRRALQLSWSPPSTPRAPAGPQTPRVVRQISISELHSLPFGQGPASDLDGAPRSPTGAPSRATEGKGVDVGGQDISPEQPVQPHSLEPKEESGPGPEAIFHGSSPGAPSEESGSLVAAALKMLIPLEDAPPPPVTSSPPQAPAGPSEQLQASYSDDNKSPEPGPVPVKPPRQREALLHQDPHAAGSEPGLGSPGAGTPTPGLAEPSQDPEPVGRAPTEGLEQGQLGPGAQEGHPGGSREAHSQVLGPEGLPTLSRKSLEEEPKLEERKQVDQGSLDLSSGQSTEAHGLKTGHSEHPQQDGLPAPRPHDVPQAQAEAGAPASRKQSPPLDSPHEGAQRGDGAGPREPTQNLPTVVELETHPMPSPTAAHTEEQGSLRPREPRAENRPEDPGSDSKEAELTPSSGSLTANEPPANPDYLFHIVFLGDSNVGKTSFLHLLHKNTFAPGLAATVGVDFRVKTLLVDNKRFALQLWDTAGQERYHSVTRQLLRKADGVVLMYDVTSQESFAHVRHWLDCLQDSGSDGVVVLLLGNKMDCEEKRQVPTEAGQQLAQDSNSSLARAHQKPHHQAVDPIYLRIEFGHIPETRENNREGKKNPPLAPPLLQPLLASPYCISFPFSFLLTMRSSPWLLVGGNFSLLNVVAHLFDMVIPPLPIYPEERIRNNSP
ncbi:ras-related protein Rab-44 isoform X1 [Felis catus]|uniref:ras-related protein Rab-44 isoform X1 n=1 Tax=Felis catus TaxID=9685 RepID=UPI001D19E8B3|nr:ras-related protein Rab-44 isoform X1 [Felis catus]